MDEAKDPVASGDDGFWDLFQDEDPGPARALNPTNQPPNQAASSGGAPMDVDEALDIREVPVMAGAAVSATGRLFRSYYVIDPTATPALRPDQARKLRTVRSPIDNEESESHYEPARGARPTDEPPVSRRASGRSRRGQRSRGRRETGRGLRGGLGYLVVIVSTVIVGLIETVITGAAFSWWTGLVLIAATIYVALTLRRSDLAVAVIAPPIAALITALTAGQLGVQGGVVERGLAVFLALGRNWPWILAAAVIGLTIAVVRSRRLGQRAF